MMAKIFLILVTVAACVGPFPAWSQEDGAAAREKAVADRFMQVLLRRPAPGTALDRVYGYHIQAGSLDEVLDQLQRDIDAGGDDAGNKAMLLGLMQLQRGNDADAAESLAAAERLRPDDAMASYYLGKAWLLVGRGDAAAEAFERSIDRKPARNEAMPVFTELGRLYGRSQQTEKALSVWTRLEATFPGDTRVGEQIAQTLAEEGQDDAALLRFEALAKKTTESNDSRSVGYQIAAAELKRKMGRSDEAIADLESILSRLRPSSWLHSDVQRRIEAGFLRSGDYGALAIYYAKQVKQQPDALELRMRLGQVQSKAGLLVDAEKTLRACVELAPTQIEPRLALVDLLQATAKYADVAGELRVLVEQDPENPDYLIRLGNTILEDSDRSKQTRYAEAAAAWQQLADARIDDAVITVQVGDLMRRIDRSDEAIKLYRHAVDLQPDQPQYREYLGEYLNRLGRADEAMTIWNSITQGERATRDNFIRLAEVLNTFEHPEKALDAFAQAAELDPTFAHRLRFTELLSRAGRYDDALKQLDAAEPDAESPEEREQLLRSRIGIYANSGKLDDRIVEARENADASRSADAYRQLALLLDAAARTDDAVVAIESAMNVDAADIGSMEVAAELYRKTSRSADAITVYRRLANLDPRFLPNYLKRIASLHMELGQVDEALAAADELIQAGPGNPESYRFYAEQCFRVGRDDAGIERLRRALQAAPRDRAARRALASALDDRFRTDEAIELYWALLEDADDLSEQRGLVQSLAALYGRKGDFDRLLNRLELRGREASDMRTATRLISEAHRSMDDLGAASTVLEPLLAENPRDAELIRQLADLSEAADDLETALEYQTQLTKLADTPENHNREMNLMISLGQMNRVEAMLQRMQGFTDPLDWINTIDRSIAKQEMTAAQRFCEFALEKYPDLWEVRARLAALLIYNDELDRAGAEIETLAALDLPDETASEKHKDELAKAKSNSKAQATSWLGSLPGDSKWFDRIQSITQMAYFFKLGRYANVTFGGGQTVRGAVDPNDVAHAKLYADALRMVLASKRSALDEFVETEHLDDVERFDSIDDPQELKRMMLYTMFLPSFSPNSTNTAESTNAEKLMWRMTETMSQTEMISATYWLLQKRAQARSPRGNNAIEIKLEPLSVDQIDLISRVFEDAAVQNADPSKRPMTTYLARFLYSEMKDAGMDDRGLKLRQSMDVKVESIDSASKALTFAISFQDLPRVKQIVDQIYNRLGDWSASATKANLTAMLSATIGVGSMKDVDQDTTIRTADVLTAVKVLTQQNPTSTKRSSRGFSQNAGMLSTYSLIRGNYQQLKLEVPLTGDATMTELIQVLAQIGLLHPQSPYRDRLFAHWTDGPPVLASRPELAEQEMKLRRSMAAYSHWWAGEPEKTYEAIVQLSDEDPENNDWWIERARLAAELKMPETSLEALDSIHPMDQATLQIRELAAMNLASQLGNLDRAKTAARRLFGMRLDKDTELALADQLTRMGMREMSAAVLQRSRRRGGQSISDLLSLADRYVAADDPEAAAEVAYSAMRKLSRGGDRNEDYYRRRAVEVLRMAGRLDAIIAQAESRVQSSPESLSLKSELGSLYTAAGRSEDAEKILSEIAMLEPDDPKTMWSAAERLTAAGKHDEAIEKFVAAAVKDPTLLNNGYYKITNCLHQCKSREKAYEGLMGLKFDGLQSHIISQLVTTMMRQRGREAPKFSKSEEAFLAKVLTQGPIDSLDDILRSVVQNPERIQSTAVADTVRRIFTEPDLYIASSQIWQSGSFGGNGQFYGVVQPCLMIVQKNEELKNEIQALLRDRVKGKDGSPIAELLLVASEVSGGVSDATAAKMKELRMKTVDEIPHHLWWQFGQVIESDKAWIASGEVVDAFEKARDVAGNNSNVMRQYQYSIGPRLADAYVRAGRKAEAKRELLKAYENTDNSEQNQFNPGYGDSEDLQTFKSIADKLVESGSRLAAIPIYADALSRPKRFELAKRWSGSRNSQEEFQKSLDETLGKLTDEDFDEYLSLSDPSAEQPDVPAIAIMPMRPTSDIDPMRSSVAAIVAAKLNETQTGREKLAEFQERAAERMIRSPDDVSLAGIMAIVSTILKQDDAPERFDTLMRLTPEVDVDTKRKSVYESIMSLYSPILVGLSAGDQATQQSASRAAERLAKLADAVERTELSETLLLGTMKYAGGDASTGEAKRALLGEMLNKAATASTPPKVVSVDTAQACIRVAESAVKVAAWPVAIDAIGRAFGGGPPLRNVSGGDSAGAVFLPQVSRNTSNRDTNDDELDGLTRRATDVLRQCRTAILEDPALAEAAYVALTHVVMPPERQTEIFAYLTLVVQSDLNEAIKNQHEQSIPDPDSISRELAIIAKVSGNTQDLLSRLAERRKLSTQKPLADVIAVQIALVGDDPSQLDSALDRLMVSVGIPETSAPSNPSDTNIVASPNDAKFSSDATMSADTLLHVLLPIQTREGMTPTALRISRYVLTLASQEAAKNRSSEMPEWLIRRLIANEQVDNNQAESFVELYLDSVRQRYAQYAQQAGIVEQQVAYRGSQLVQPLTKAKRFGLAARYQRPMYIEMLRRDQTLGESFTSLPIATADPKTQYDYFTRLMFGSADEPSSSSESAETIRSFLQLDHWRYYAEPPAVLIPAAPHLTAARQQHVASNDFPLESIGQSMSVAAAACGETDEWIDRLLPLIQSPGDDVDAVIGIAYLTDGRIEEAGEVIDRVAKHLKETEPTEKVPTPMLDDSAALLVRAYKIDSLRERVVKAWPSIQTHFRKRDIMNKAGHYNLVGTRILPSFAHGASVDHGLNHFVAYQMPGSGTPVNESSSPTWIAKEGTLRYGGGMDLNSLMIKYPLAGDFTFTVREVQHPSGSFGVVADGETFQAQSWVGQTHVMGMSSREQMQWKLDSVSSTEDNLNVLRFEGDHVTFEVNGTASGQTIRSTSFPFVGLFMQSYGDCEAGDIAIRGDVTIPRFVNLIDAELRGWSCSIHGGNLPKMTLRSDGDLSDTNVDAVDQPAQDLAWDSKDGSLLTGPQKTPNTPGQCRHIQYQRPLLDGETVTYEADYLDDQTEVHPSIGRVAVMIRPSGVKLRWLVQTQSLETDNNAYDTEVEPDEILVKGGLELTPSTRVSLTAEGDRCSVSVNGQPVCRFTMALDRRPGLLCEKDREAKITSMQLAGDWPETLPADLLE